MPHITVEWSSSLAGRRSFWAAVRRALLQRVNILVPVSDHKDRERCRRSLSRMVHKDDLPCLVRIVANGVVVLWL